MGFEFKTDIAKSDLFFKEKENKRLGAFENKSQENSGRSEVEKAKKRSSNLFLMLWCCAIKIEMINEMVLELKFCQCQNTN
jgi:hypothetical protein